MSWNPYFVAYLGQEATVRDHRGERPRGDRPTRRPDPRVTTPPLPQRPDPRVTTPPFPQQPIDPRVTTRPQDVRPRDDRDDDRRHPRRPRPRFRDYGYVANYGWIPRWYPYWDPYWKWYWEYLFWYYRGFENPEYAEWARDQVLRSMAPQRGWL